MVSKRPRQAIPALLVLAATLLPGGAAAQDNPCDPNPVLPTDCVTILGSVGEPVASLPGEGFLNIMSPVIDPILSLSSGGAGDGHLYVLNPTSNMVRVLDPAASLAVVKDIPVCYRPSALAQSDDGSQVLVACHAANAIGVIDTARNQMVAVIQDRDAQGRPLLQEPMAMAVRGNSLYVASSQSNQVAEISLAARAVVRYLSVPGVEPRALRLTPDGQFLVVANLLAGNRSEPILGTVGGLTNPATAAGAVCGPLLLGDPSALAVFTDTDPGFMNTSHPDYPSIAECYLFNHTFAPALEVGLNPARSDHDVVVLRTSDGAMVSTTSTLATDPGTLNFDITLNATGTRVYLAATHARNDLDENFQPQPLLNRLVILDLDALTGALSLAAGGIKELDDNWLDPAGVGTSLAATPHAVTVAGSQLLVAAAGSDRLLVLDGTGSLVSTIAVGAGPKGVLASGTVAWAYDALGMTVTQVDLGTGATTATASIGPSPLSQIERIGGKLFNSAKFASNQTFSCASCHPDGHTDGLLWKLNSADHLRSTQTLQEIAETAAYHWDGAKCNLKKILQDGINNLFLNPGGPSDCEMKTMIDWMNNLVRPHSPYRAADDSMSDDARLGLLIMHRGRFKSVGNLIQRCNDRPLDPASEHKLLARVGDPFSTLFNFNGGGGPFPASLDSETCGNANCHVSPHWESDGFRNGDPGQGLIDGFQAVSNTGSWDRLGIMHDARTGMDRYLFALDTYRQFSGAPAVRPTDNYSGVLSTHGFNDQFFRHPEYNFDGDAATHGFALTDALTRFSMEEEELQTGAAGLTLVMDVANKNAPPVNDLLQLLSTAAAQGKVVLLGQGTLGGVAETLTWNPVAGSFSLGSGGSILLTDLKNSLIGNDALAFHGGLMNGQGSLPHPKLVAVTRGGSPILCDEGYTDYLATLQVGEAGVPLVLQGIDLVAGSQVLLNGSISGLPLAGAGPDFTWTLPVAGGVETVHSLQVLSPLGLQSNAIPLPVVGPVVAALEPLSITADQSPQPLSLLWPDQFGVTGPGTRYDVFRGKVSDLRLVGFAAGACLAEDLFPATILDLADPVAGDAFYYLVRAENQVNLTSWGSALRDAGINGGAGACAERFSHPAPPAAPTAEMALLP